MADLVNGGCDIVGVLEQKMPLATGESARGQWQRQDIVIALTDVQYPTKICVELFNNSAHLADNIPEGSRIRVSVNIQSREYQGRWFTGIRGWRLETLADSAQGQAPMPQQGYQQPMQPQQGYQQPAQPQQGYQQPVQPQQGGASFPTQDGGAVAGGAFDDLPF
ncbi:MAG: hypothetical protein CSA97_02210 [Bacteroidetes bacterium]|nr:MAG: hypothetical protein CSA97_02210 [Bacteroidota bacterium]